MRVAILPFDLRFQKSSILERPDDSFASSGAWPEKLFSDLQEHRMKTGCSAGQKVVQGVV